MNVREAVLGRRGAHLPRGALGLHRRRRARWMFAALSLVTGTVVLPGQADAQAPPAFGSDDFDRTTLGAPWTVVDPVGDSTVSMAGAGTGDARLLLSVPAGTAHEPWNTNSALRVMRPATDSDFTAVAKFESLVAQRAQIQGILVQQDVDDWLRFEVNWNGTTVKAYAASTEAGVSGSRLNTTALSGPDSYVRVSRSGDTWMLATSGDGATWRTAGSFTRALDVTSVGVMAGNAQSLPAHTAVVDYFFEASAPVDPEDGGGPGTTTTTAPATTTTAPTTTATTAPSGPTAFPSDDFDRTTLGPPWTVVDPLDDGTVAMTGAGTADARLALSVPGGVGHDPWHVDNALRAMQPAADGDFVADVKFDSVPTARYQSQGLIVQEDADDWLRFNVHSNGTSLRAYAATTVAGVSTKRIDLNTTSGSPIWLRVQRAGDDWTLRTSTNGSTWRTEGSFAHAADVTAVGPFAGNSGSPAPAFTALVDYVFEAASPIVPEDTPGTSPSTTTTSPSTTTTAPSTTTTTTTPPPDGGPSITAWYGDTQVMGAHGQPQTWVNVLGNVADPHGVAALSYTLNGGSSRRLTIGPDLRRLQFPGDFNADIAYSSLNTGSNAVAITARDTLGNVTTRTVTVVKQSGSAPLPYSTDWASATRINDQAQVVDGNWRIDGHTIRPNQMGYDRLVMLGDISWHDYEMTVPVTVHGLGPGNGSQNSGNSLVGFALNWRGHTQTSNEQPFRYWYPTGALGWYRWYEPTPKFEFRGNNDTPVVRHNRFRLEFGMTYVFKARSDTVPGGIQYSWKVWPQGQPEPAAWDLTFTSNSGPPTGSVGLIAHHSDVQFGNVTVTSIP